MNILVGILAGMVAGVIIGVLVDRDVLYKISGKIKIKGRGHQVSDLMDLNLEDPPPGVKKRHIKRFLRMKRKLKK